MATNGTARTRFTDGRGLTLSLIRLMWQWPCYDMFAIADVPARAEYWSRPPVFTV